MNDESGVSIADRLESLANDINNFEAEGQFFDAAESIDHALDLLASWQIDLEKRGIAAGPPPLEAESRAF